ncbi:hypothetical protein HMF8227_02892 [Saliniradius amylolyticus]|uniref:HemY N-terminal domain-containing protein n=1 Tax=Saliniradius amylolyticus TaxID=2183582 RepID=A0A2S2E808_9ALTE|nr:heme biosynthesis HemY N-terminal domain-containing protein [Saliniradius amylolyticus]AWL13340.1 hypothetical protein HMF8227_02892 [Saliniradius amylolyticus]
MIRALLLGALLLAGLVVGPALLGHQGYVLIALEHWTVEMSVIALSIILIGGIIGFLLLEWLVHRLLWLVTGSKRWLGGLSSRRRKKAFTLGLVAMDEANFAEAEKQLAKAQSDQFSGVNLLAEAQVAVRRGDWDKAESLWQQACEYKASELAARLHLVERQLQLKKPDTALEQLQQLPEKHHSHPKVARLWCQALAEAGRWQELEQQLRSWKKQLGLQEYQSWAQLAAEGMFAELASKEGAHSLQQRWQALSRAKRQDVAFQAAYIDQLMAQGLHQQAEQLLVEFQKKGPQPALLPLYRQLRLSNPVNALKQLESWLKQDDSNAELLSVLGGVAMRSGDLALADRALGKALTLRDDPQDMRLLAEVKERLQQPQQALELYKASLDG